MEPLDATLGTIIPMLGDASRSSTAVRIITMTYAIREGLAAYTFLARLFHACIDVPLPSTAINWANLLLILA